MNNKQTTMITYKNYITKLVNGKAIKARVADVLENKETFETFAGKEVKVIRARMSWLSEKNREVLRAFTTKHNIELIQVMTDPSIITDLTEYFNAAMTYTRKTEPTIEIENKDIAILKSLIKKYNKKSLIKTITKN